jgi:hypothetical protein
VVPSLRRHQRDSCGGHVGRVGDEHIDGAAQPAGQRREQIARVHRGADRGQVGPGAAHRHRIDVRSVQPDPGHGRGDGQPDRAAAAAQLDHQRLRPSGQVPHGRPHEQPAALPRHENPVGHGDSQPVELDPADQVLQRGARDPGPDQSSQLRRAGRRRQQQLRLLLGEHAAGAAQRRHHPGRGDRAGGTRLGR